MHLRIGHFQAGYPVPDGTTTAVHGLSLGLAKAGHFVTIYGCGTPAQDPSLPTHPKLQAALYPAAFRIPFFVPPALLRRLERNEDGLDLLVINTMFNPPNRAVARAAAKGRIPYLVSPHDPYHPELLKKNYWRKRLYAQVIENRILNRAAAVQILSPSHDPFLRRIGYRGTTVVIPNGFDASCVPAPTGTDAHLAGSPRLLFLGRLDMNHKGLDLLLSGFAQAIRSGAVPPGAMLNFVGPDSGDRIHLEKIAKSESIENRVKFFGRVSDEERWAALRSCDLLFLCSRYDGFGLAALEAMLCAKPVVVSREAGISSWVEEARCGFVVAPTAGSISDGIARAITSRQHWTELGEHGRGYAHQNLTWERMGCHAAQCYRELIENLKSALQKNPGNSDYKIIGANLKADGLSPYGA
jgi:glycosyltransferase involved in cell wall biosynthesis